MITIEMANERDFEALCTIDKEVLGSTSRRNFIAAAILAEQCFIARDGRTLAGFAVLDQSFFGKHFISLLVIKPSYYYVENAAVALIDHIEANCPTEKLFTSARNSLTDRRQFWENQGFVQSGKIENLNDAEPEIIYFKKLWRKGKNP